MWMPFCDIYSPLAEQNKKSNKVLDFKSKTLLDDRKIFITLITKKDSFLRFLDAMNKVNDIQELNQEQIDFLDWLLEWDSKTIDNFTSIINILLERIDKK